VTPLDPNGRPYVACARCRQNIVWPQSLSAEDKAIIAGECRSSSLNCAKLVVSRFGFDLREAKALTFHITRERGKCHRCGAKVFGEISVCTNCRSANLDW
jgi:hypothetical protein